MSKGSTPPATPRRAETLVVSLLALVGLGLAGSLLLSRGRPVPELVRPEGQEGSWGLEPRRIDVNSATTETLQVLPGIGPRLGERIVEYRQRRGPFENVWDLRNVRGIGPALIERIEPFIVALDPAKEQDPPAGKIPGVVEE